MKLTKAQRASFFAGHWPKLQGEGQPPEAGTVYRLSSRLSLEVTRVRRKPTGWKLDYVVTDRRSDVDRYLRPASHKVPTDEHGDHPMTKEEELGYTTNRAVSLEGIPAVPLEFQNVISMKAHGDRASRAEAERAEEMARSQIRAITEMLREMAVEAAREGRDINPLLASIVRSVKSEREAA